METRRESGGAWRSLVCNEELARRPARAPDPAAENAWLVTLAQQLADSPKDILDRIAQAARELCRAHSAGVSLLEREHGRPALRWHAVAGLHASQLGRTAPCEFGLPGGRADGDVILFASPGRCLPDLDRADARIVEALVVPLQVAGEAVGTLCVMSADEQRRFDAEDARTLGRLARFAAAARQSLASHQAASRAEESALQIAASLRRSEQRSRAVREALRESELQRRLLEKLPAGAYICDAEGLITHYNLAAVRLWGRAPKLNDPIDRFCGSFKLFASDGRRIPHEDCWMARALQNDKDYDGEEIVIERPDGTRRTVLAHASPIREESGTIVGAVNILVDISDRKRAENALRESEQRFAKFMQHLPGLAWIKDLDGRYVFANEAASRTFGRYRKDIFGMTDEEIFPASVARSFHENDRRALASESGCETIETLEHDDGVHHSLVKKFVIPDSQGRPSLIGGMAIDLTERVEVETALREANERLRESEARFREMADNAPILIWVNDLDGCEFVNREYLRFLGASAEDVHGMNWAGFVHPEDAPGYLESYRAALARKQPFAAEFRFRRADGEWRWMRSSGVPRFTSDGTMIGFMGCSADFTELKTSEEALREIDRRKNDFLAMLAHELRNPLAPIRNSLAILRVAGGSRAEDEIHEMMERQVDQMVRLVDDLLEIARITRGKIELRRERVDLAAVLRAAIETSQPLIAGARHAFEVSLADEPLVVDADATRLAQVFSNLLNNAAKYTEPGGHIRLEARREGGEAVVSVADDGIGIASEMLPEVFEIFTQIDRTASRAQGGLGIGLALVKRLVELHRGRVEARSAGPGTGSEFVVRLPLEGAGSVAAERAGEAEGTHGPLLPRRVLVVDDNRDAADSLGILLRFYGADVQVVHDGRAALEAFASFQPGIVLLDLGMPGMDGYEVGRWIREQPGADAVRLIALTGWGQPEDRRRSRAAGFDHHLVKPVRPEALKALLAS
jgi:PAS domain S-box-containing protein